MEEKRAGIKRVYALDAETLVEKLNILPASQRYASHIIVKILTLGDEVDSIPHHAKHVISIYLELELLGLLPGEALVGEVAVLSGLVVDWVRKVELFDDDTYFEG